MNRNIKTDSIILRSRRIGELHKGLSCLTRSHGIIDAIDKCISLPETFNNYQDNDGCPEFAADYDTDAVADPDLYTFRIVGSYFAA